MDIEHRKFFKHNHRTSLSIGSYIDDNFMITETSGEMTSLPNVLFVVSSTCSSCNMGAIEEFIQERHDQFEFTLVTDNLESTYIKEQENIHILKRNIFNFIDSIGIPGVPFVVGINKVHQIISAGPSSSISAIYDVLSPFFEVEEK